jgi:GNAT superfamily N-acetyltransferase
MKASIALRPYRETDRHFVTDSFLHTFGRSAYAEGVEARVLIDLLEPLLITWTTTCAVDPDDDTEILGWCCYRAPDLIAWLFVKPFARRAGVARALMTHAGVGKFLLCPFVPTKLFDQPFQAQAAKLGYRVRFRPFLANVAALVV